MQFPLSQRRKRRVLFTQAQVRTNIWWSLVSQREQNDRKKDKETEEQTEFQLFFYIKTLIKLQFLNHKLFRLEPFSPRLCFIVEIFDNKK
jgi:hypothetical protein